MERFDFSSVMAILMEHIPKEAYGNQVALLELLFAGYVVETGHVFDNGQVNKWLKGKEHFPSKISTYYMEQKHRYDLYNAVERKLLPMMDDPAMAMQELYELLILDHGVSEQKKTEMIEGFPFDTLEEIAEFLTQLLCFAMIRCPDGRMSIRSMLRELTVWDRILGGRVPPLCQWFQGREEELEELHELLQREGKVFLHGIPGIGKSELVKAYAVDLIRVRKDGKNSKATYHDHIRTLFALFRLSKRKREILRNMTLAPDTGVDAAAFAEWLKLPSRNEINDLIELGLIHPEERLISLHPMIREMVQDELPPTVRKCHDLIESIHWDCRGHGMENPNYRQMFQTVERIMDEAGKDDLPGYLRFLEDVFPYMEKYHYESGMRKILREMDDLLKEERLGTISDRALLLDYCAAMEKDREKAIKLEIEAIRLIGEVKQEAALLAANLHSNLGEQYHAAGELDLAAIHMEQGFYLMEEYGLKEYHDSILQSLNYAMLLGERKEFDRAAQFLMKLAAFLKDCAREDTLDYAAVLETRALLYMMEGNVKEGWACYQKCLSVWESVFIYEPERIEEKRAEIRGNLLKVGQYCLLNSGA